MSQGEFLQAAAGWGRPGYGPGFASLAQPALTPAALASTAPTLTDPAAAPVAGRGIARAAIARAAQATGVDFNYLLAQARLESSLNPNARAGTSSAAGLYQFTQGTWAQMLQQHGSEVGLDDAIPGGTLAALRDPAQRAQLMALRFDPDTSARMAAELAGDNQAALTQTLGRTPKASELYLAHFLGTEGASKFLSALAADPGQSAAALLPKAAGANRTVFFDAGGAPRSVGAVMALIEQRMATAMGDPGQAGENFDLSDPATLAALAQRSAGEAAPGFTPGWAGNLGREFASAQAANGGNDAGSSLPRPAASMADTLQSAFGLAEAGSNAGGNTPDFVRSAYGRLRALGL